MTRLFAYHKDDWRSLASVVSLHFGNENVI
jgi:hypothetical protein